MRVGSHVEIRVVQFLVGGRREYDEALGKIWRSLWRNLALIECSSVGVRGRGSGAGV